MTPAKFAGPRVTWWASLVPRTLLLVTGVVLALGAFVVSRLTDEDRAAALRDARRAGAAAEAEMRALSRDLVRSGGAFTVNVVEHVDGRTREWLEVEPLTLYRDRTHPERVDVDALRQALTARVRARTRETSQRVATVTELMEARATERIERVLAAERAEGEARAVAASSERRARLFLRLALLLAGLTALLALALWRLVLRPVALLRAEVGRMAGGDLVTPVRGTNRADEVGALARDVEGMRADLRGLHAGLEAEVERKTADLHRSLLDRTEALADRTAALVELRATQDRLVQAAKMASLGTLAGGLAHEFNNLLGGILGCVKSARDDNRDPVVAEDLAVVERTASRGLTLVKSMLDVARPGAGGLAPVDLGVVVRDVVAACAPAAHRDRVDLRREWAEVPLVLGDAAQLQQVALNLVTNALAEVDEGEVVVVALRSEGDRVVLEVRDGGPGVAPDVRDRIFEPFFTTRDGGTGLGLFVSYGIVTRHGGSIEVGDAPEGGARFTVRLPLASPRSTAPGAVVSSSPSAS